MGQVKLDAGGRTPSSVRLGAACSLALFAGLLFKIVTTNLAHQLYVEDDAYYYILTALNIAKDGLSSFDGQSLTNGYHPLWMIFLALQYVTVGPSILFSLVIQAVLLSLGLLLFVRELPRGQVAAGLVFAVTFAVLFAAIGLDGMEVALLVACVGLFVLALNAAIRGRRNGWLWLGLTSGLCVGARIDSAFFIVPAVIAAPINREERALAIGVLVVLGAAYVAYNLSMFGAAMPISSTIKSMGGLQINHVLLAQLSAPLDPHRHARAYFITFLALVGSPVLWLISKRGTIGWTLAAAASIGGLIYIVKLVFLSAWVVWPWYNFAVLFPMLAALYVWSPPSAFARPKAAAGDAQRPGATAPAFRFVGLAIALTVLGLLAARLPLQGDNGFSTINRMAVRVFSARLHGVRVAMGDRAGSFAAAYPGPVVQLEGLVNDKAYYDVLRSSGDLHALLCRRGVRAFASYARNLGAYETARVPVFQPHVTQIRGPTLLMRRADEIGHLEDLTVYDNRADGGDGDNTFYLWRLPCP